MNQNHLNQPSQKIGVMLCGHGSRSNSAVNEFAAMAAKLREAMPQWVVEHGYLEFANPVIRVGLDRLVEQGCERILAVPGMLFAAMHAKNDIPSVLNSYAAKHDIRVDYGRELGVDPKMIDAAAYRINEAIDEADRKGGIVPKEETCLVVIGRGASDPDANSNVAKIARVLWEGLGFGWCEIGYSGVTFPLIEPCLEHVARLGYHRVVVFPYFLFSGILIDRIYGFTDQVALRHKDIEFVKAGYLNDHEGVIQTFTQRVQEILVGNTDMNCSMCKYRTQVLGFESEVGLPQESHHHHVEGQGAAAPGSNVKDCERCHDFCTGLCRLEAEHHHHGDGHHHHHHATYPHPHHPHGPESVRKGNKHEK